MPNQSLIEKTESQIQSCIDATSKWSAQKLIVADKREICSAAIHIAKNKSVIMSSCSKEYNDAAQAFNRIGQFIQASSTGSDLPARWHKILAYISISQNAHSLEHHSLTLQRPAFKTILFNMVSFEKRQYITDEYKKYKPHEAQDVYEAATAAATETIKASVEGQSDNSDARGALPVYVQKLSQAFSAWKESNNHYAQYQSELDSQLTHSEAVLGDASAITEKLIDKHKKMKDALNEKTSYLTSEIQRGRLTTKTGVIKASVRNRVGETSDTRDSTTESLETKKNLVCDFTNLFKSEEHRNARNLVEQEKDNFSRLIDKNNDTVTGLLTSRNTLINMAKPYMFPVTIKINDDYSEEDQHVDDLTQTARTRLEDLPAFKVDQSRVSAFQNNLLVFEKNENNFDQEYNEITRHTKIEDFVLHQQRKNPKRFISGIESSMLSTPLSSKTFTLTSKQRLSEVSKR